MPALVHTHLLLCEDFQAFPIGSISGWPYTAEGEYHVVTPRYDTGAWEEANISTRWGRGTGCWAVVADRDRRAIEATYYATIDTPLLVAGSRFWDDYAFQADVRPLSWARPLGLVVRYQNSRQYYYTTLGPDLVSLVRRDHEVDVPLRVARWAGSADAYVRMCIVCDGPHFSISLNGAHVLEADDSAFAGGKIGLMAEAPARFSGIRVTCDESSKARTAAAEQAWAQEEAALRASLPQPLLWRRISTAGFGTDRNLRYGDLNGDGSLEIVVPQALHRGSLGEYPMIQCITAVDLDGRVLWQQGEPNAQLPEMLGDLCIQAYDWNGDGKDEVLFTQDFRLKILDGATGHLIRDIPTPIDTQLRDGEPYVRTFGDSLYFADLEGRGVRRNLLLKDRYKTIWAFDADLNLLWSHLLNTGHYPIAYDVDDDGKEELLVGYSLLDHDGSILWSLDLADHLDGAFMGRFSPDGPVRICMGCSDEGFVMTDVHGNILAHHRRGHCQGASIGRFLPNRQDLQIATITFWHHPGIMTTYDTAGNVLAEVEPLHIGSILPPVDWAGDGRAFLLHNTHPSRGGLMDIFGHRAVPFPDDGHPFLCSEALDIDGDGHQEILSWDFHSIWIYRADPARLGPARPYNTTPLYNNSNYRSRWLI